MEKEFVLQILGRTLEHLGVQMYKKRNTAIAELVANSWDAGSGNVYISIPLANVYNLETSEIIIEDDGAGMTETEIQDAYLVIGRNRRNDENLGKFKNRNVMGRKGIGKLAGFGMAKSMTVQTWTDGICHQFTLDSAKLKSVNNKPETVKIIATVIDIPADVKNKESGTRIILKTLKHKTPIDLESIQESLARRYSRGIRGLMTIHVNGAAITEPNIQLIYKVPNDDTTYKNFTLEDNNKILARYGFTQKPIRSSELRGFTIYVNGKTAQAPNFFFEMEGKARGQHATKYVSGEIVADYLDTGVDDLTDYISTDRQEIDWENEITKPLKKWGEKFIQEIFNEWMESRGSGFEEELMKDPELAARISSLDPTSQTQISKILKILGKSEADPDRAKELASALVKAYEYRHFHDVIEDIEEASQDPVELEKLLTRFLEWKLLESRAIFEIIHGRLAIIEKFHALVINGAPETPSKLSRDNLHDIIAQYPWLLNPEWQILSEEMTISNQLIDWNREDLVEKGDQIRYDFIGLTGPGKLVIIEIKRANHAVTFDELQRLKKYKERLYKAHPDIHMVMICGGVVDASPDELKSWQEADDREIIDWKEIYQRTKLFYEHYRDVLEGNVKGNQFSSKENEIAKTREILKTGTVHRGIEEREKGLGGQDIDYGKLAKD